MSTRMKTIALPLLLAGALLAVVILRSRPPAGESVSPAGPPKPNAQPPESAKVRRPDPRPRESETALATVTQPSPAPISRPGDPTQSTASEREQIAIHDELVAETDWNTFYLKARRGCTPFELADLIVHRLANELQLTDAQCATIHELLKKEHDEAGHEVLEKIGKPTLENLLTPREDNPELNRAPWKQVADILEGVRRRNDTAFAAAFDTAQVTAINEHLRNKNYMLCSGSLNRYSEEKAGPELPGDNRVRLLGLGKTGQNGVGYASDGETRIVIAAIPHAFK